MPVNGGDGIAAIEYVLRREQFGFVGKVLQSHGFVLHNVASRVGNALSVMTDVGALSGNAAARNSRDFRHIAAQQYVLAVEYGISGIGDYRPEIFEVLRMCDVTVLVMSEEKLASESKQSAHRPIIHSAAAVGVLTGMAAT